MCVGIIAIKTERTQIHFLSDVLVAVASLDLKVPNVRPDRILDRSNSRFACHFDRSFLDTNILFSI